MAVSRISECPWNGNNPTYLVARGAMRIPGMNKKILKAGALIHSQLLPNRNKPNTSAIANNGINAILKVILPMKPKTNVVTGLSSDIGVNRVAIPVLIKERRFGHEAVHISFKCFIKSILMEVQVKPCSPVGHGAPPNHRTPICPQL